MKRIVEITNVHQICGLVQIPDIALMRKNYVMGNKIVLTEQTKRHAVNLYYFLNNLNNFIAHNLCPTLGCQAGCQPSPTGGVCTCPQGYSLDQRFKRTCSGNFFFGNIKNKFFRYK